MPLLSLGGMNLQGWEGVELNRMTKPKTYPVLEPLRSDFEPCYLCEGEGCPGCDFVGLILPEQTGAGAEVYS